MLSKYFSRVDTDLLLHAVFRSSEWQPGDGFQRQNLVEDEQFLQCAVLKMPATHTFPPHAHVWHPSTTPSVIAQESWVVVRGSVKCSFFDIDDQLLTEVLLDEGDASFSFGGGHTYEARTSQTLVYEFKTGPYLGVSQDKRPIQS